MPLLNSFRFITNGTENFYEEIVFVLKASSNIQVSWYPFTRLYFTMGTLQHYIWLAARSWLSSSLQIPLKGEF